MIVDASALLAVILFEPERDQFLSVLDAADSLSMSVINFAEAGIKVDRSSDLRRALAMEEVVRELAIEIVPISVGQGHEARRAHKRFGRGSGHLAGLNLGDCFAFALAKAKREPLLFKGNDFAHPDVLAEIEAAA